MGGVCRYRLSTVALFVPSQCVDGDALGRAQEVSVAREGAAMVAVGSQPARYACVSQGADRSIVRICVFRGGRAAVCGVEYGFPLPFDG